MWYSNIDRILFPLKRKEILTSATTRMNLQDILRSEARQSQKVNYCMIPLMGGSQGSQVQRTESRMNGGGWGCREGEGLKCFIGMEFQFQFGRMTKFWK